MKNNNEVHVYVRADGQGATIKNITIVGTIQQGKQIRESSCQGPGTYQVPNGDTCYIKTHCKLDNIREIYINGKRYEPKIYSGVHGQCVRQVQGGPSGGGGGGQPPGHGKNSGASLDVKFEFYVGGTDQEGVGRVYLPGLAFAAVFVRGVAVRGVNYTYVWGAKEASNIGAVVRPDRGVYIIHGGRIKEVDSERVCGGASPAQEGIRFDVTVFVGWQTRKLVDSVDIAPGVSFDLEDPEPCEGNKAGPGGGDKKTLGCLIGKELLRGAKFLVVTAEATGQGGHLPKSDIIVVPLAGGLPPLWRAEFATWRRWVDRRPEALVVSYAEALADGGEITYLVRLWVYRYR